MSEQGFCSKCGYAYLSNNHLANCFQSTQFDAGDRIKTLEAERDALKARVGKLEKALKDILPAKDGTHYTASEMILVARAALAEDGGI